MLYVTNVCAMLSSDMAAFSYYKESLLAETGGPYVPQFLVRRSQPGGNDKSLGFLVCKMGIRGL